MVECYQNVDFDLKKFIMSVQLEKIMNLSTVRNIEGVHQAKYYYGIVKKSKFSFSCHLQIDKINQ